MVVYNPLTNTYCSPININAIKYPIPEIKLVNAAIGYNNFI